MQGFMGDHGPWDKEQSFLKGMRLNCVAKVLENN